MTAKKKIIKTEFKEVYIPLPPAMVEIRRAGLLLLLQWIKDDRPNTIDPRCVDCGAPADCDGVRCDNCFIRSHTATERPTTGAA